MLIAISFAIAFFALLTWVVLCVQVKRRGPFALVAVLVFATTANAAEAEAEAKAKAKAKAMALFCLDDSCGIKQPTIKPAVSGWLTSYAAAQSESARTGKPLLIYLRTKACVYCEKLERGPFHADAVKAALTSVVSAKLDQEDAKAIVKALAVTRYPTFVIAAPDGTVIRMATGYMDDAALAAWIRGPKAVQASQAIQRPTVTVLAGS